jgi:hypothetical protein
MLNLAGWVNHYLAHPGENDAAGYGAMIVNVPGTAWRCIGVHLLTGAENGGQHNVFIEPVDATGKRVAGCIAGWTWKDKRENENAPATPLDKPPSELAGNIPLGAGQIATVWLTDASSAVLSDRVSGLTTAPNIPDQPGATRFHQSYLVVYQRGATVPVPFPDPDPAPPSGDVAVLQQRVTFLEAQIKAIIPVLESGRWHLVDAMDVTIAGVKAAINT